MYLSVKKTKQFCSMLCSVLQNKQFVTLQNNDLKQMLDIYWQLYLWDKRMEPIVVQ